MSVCARGRERYAEVAEPPALEVLHGWLVDFEEGQVFEGDVVAEGQTIHPRADDDVLAYPRATASSSIEIGTPGEMRIYRKQAELYWSRT